MDRPTMLLEAILAQARLDLGLSVERDILVIRRRTEHEGVSFLTITLPKLGDALLQGIESGQFTCPTDFSRHGKLPRLLGGFFNCVFDRDGRLKSDVDPQVILYLRTITDFWKKPKIACSPEREAQAEKKYVAIEEGLKNLQTATNQGDEYLDKIAGIIWTQVFPEVDPNDIICRHGPGNTADRRLSNDRHSFSWWYQRAEPWFPSALHCYPNYGYAAEAVEIADGADGGLTYLTEGDEPPVRVVFVPKTLKTPRVIALEPSPMQYIQQGLLAYIIPRLEKHRLTRHSIRFSDQGPNRELAYKASLDRSLATLDLSDASDRVHVDLVKRIFRKCGIADYLSVARSTHAALPSGAVVKLEKFASMGSAICFPVEAMVFYTIIQLALHSFDCRHPTSSSIANYSRDIAVYGDDIIIPVRYTDAVVYHLEAYGLKVNVNKSFRASLFRESCGADYYNGEWVRPIYARELAPDDRRDWTASQVMSWTETANHFYRSGWWIAAQAVREMLESVLRCRIPRARKSCGSGVYFASVMYDTDLRHINNDDETQVYAQKRVTFTPVKTKDDIDGNAISCLNKWFSSLQRNRLDSYSSLSYEWNYRDKNDHIDQSENGSNPLTVPRIIRRIQSTIFQLGYSGSILRSIQSTLRSLHHISGGARFVLGIQNRRNDGRYECNRSEGVYLLSDLTKTWSDLSMNRSTGSDYQFSVKRGAFKSKRRWVTMFS